MSANASRVSVVIPTIGRPELARAISSALNQTVAVLEVLVVGDTAGEINVPNDPRVRLLRSGPGAGGNAARQMGVLESQGDLVALLDDDDEWLPEHIAGVLQAVADKGSELDDVWVASTRVRARRADGSESIWPERLKTNEQSLAQYIFRKESIRGGVGFMQASCLIFPRSLALHVPFDATLRFHQDVGWLNDLSSEADGIAVVQSPDATVVHHIGETGVAKSITARRSIAWALERLDKRDTRTLGDFICVHSLQAAKNNGSVWEMIRTLAVANRVGRPSFAANAYGVALTLKRLVRR
ncbi:glycosyltransferase family 2 protein [Plantibacter sp. CFBP 8775]|uniref:glycosyltransferase family 2 protein n=1 Tax=Plantibacter sp. CFBP 8775 TaxID=2774038 RepID=UPI00178554A1|nr:glycosyltransferase [Plantibacter sp. CFBP 8775]MBD8104058.1 glycosyltransferase [Plantibacter sp. CFBP 8775]